MLPKEAHSLGYHKNENKDMSFQDFCLVPCKCGLLETTLPAIPAEP